MWSEQSNRWVISVLIPPPTPSHKQFWASAMERVGWDPTWSIDPDKDWGAYGHGSSSHEIRRWVTERIEELLRLLDHRDPRATAEQLMMVRTGTVVSGGLDGNERLNHDFVTCWDKLIDDGLPHAL
jgi:hypothetical protein